MPKSSLIQSFIKYRREKGWKAALARALKYLKLRPKYMDAEYPSTGIHCKVLTNDFWETLSRGRWEPDIIKYLSGIVKAGTTILDAGAWIGPYTLLFGNLVSETGHVYSFEPDSKARGILSKNVRKNRLGWVTIEPLALSNRTGKSRFYFYGSRGNSMSNIIGRQQENSASIQVETTTIDDYCKARRIRPDGIKIDVEGAEALVIEGARNTIKDCAPWVMLEFHGQFITEEQRGKTWDSIVSGAEKIVFLSGESQRYSYGSEVTALPDCPYFNVWIQF